MFLPYPFVYRQQYIPYQANMTQENVPENENFNPAQASDTKRPELLPRDIYRSKSVKTPDVTPRPPTSPATQVLKPKNKVSPPPPKPRNRKTFKKPEGYVKRPLNAFFRFSQKKRKELCQTAVELPLGHLSKVLSTLWKNMSNEEKRPYFEEFLKAKLEHSMKHPNYTYPNRKKSPADSLPDDLDDVTPTMIPGEGYPWNLVFDSIGVDYFQF